jgi:hypothetical protein
MMCDVLELRRRHVTDVAMQRNVVWVVVPRDVTSLTVAPLENKIVKKHFN